MSMDQASMDLTSVTNLHMLGCFLLHGWPKISKVEQLLEKSLLTLIVPTFTRMNFLHDKLCFRVPKRLKGSSLNPFRKRIPPSTK